MRDFLVVIVACSVLEIVCDFVLVDGRVEKYVKSIIAIFMFYLCINSLFNLLFKFI